MEAWYLSALQQFEAQLGRPPWIRELAKWLDKGKTTVHSALESLEYKGYVWRFGDTNARGDRRFTGTKPAWVVKAESRRARTKGATS